MGWVLGSLATGVLPTTTGVLYKPRYPVVVRGIRVTNASGGSATVSVYYSNLNGGNIPLNTPSQTLLANESVLIDTPVMLAGTGEDYISGVGSTSSGLSYVIWGVVER